MRLGSGELQVTLRTGLGRALAIMRADRAMIRAARRLPKPVPWEWARPRLVPLLAGPMIDPEGDSLIRSVMDPGVAVVFGIDLGKAFPFVDETVARRWECSVDQIQEVATANLRRRTARLAPTVVRTATLSGHRIRLIQDRPAWASSILLVEDEVRRLFGNHDQLFAAPQRNTLLNFQPDIPERIAGEIVVDFEMGAACPLMLDPFMLEDGRLRWGGTEDWDEDGGHGPD
jgi:hypothetical protein